MQVFDRKLKQQISNINALDRRALVACDRIMMRDELTLADLNETPSERIIRRRLQGLLLLKYGAAIAIQRGDWADARLKFQAGLDLFTGDQPSRGPTNRLIGCLNINLVITGSQHEDTNETRQAVRQSAMAALERLEREDDPTFAGYALSVWGAALVQYGQTNRGVTRMRQACSFGLFGDPQSKLELLATRGTFGASRALTNRSGLSGYKNGRLPARLLAGDLVYTDV